jgi:hypothetical protein
MFHEFSKYLSEMRAKRALVARKCDKIRLFTFMFFIVIYRKKRGELRKLRQKPEIIFHKEANILNIVF